MTYLKAFVKQIISPDTFVLVSHSPNFPPPQRTITLSSILTPKCALKSLTYEKSDEPFAWEARNFVRNLLIGQDVEFCVESSNGDRTYGSVKFQGKDVALEIVKAGLAKVRSTRGVENLQQLLDAEAAAKSAKLKIWSNNEDEIARAIRSMTWSVGNAALCKDFYNSHKDEKLKAIIEHVRDGSSMRATFVDYDFHASFSLTGVQCGGFKRQTDGAGNQQLVAEPFAEEAKFFVEIRLLNRDVDIRMDAVDEAGELQCSVLHPRGNIAVFLLREGLGKINERTIRLVSDHVGLRDAARHAQEKKLKLWAGYNYPDENNYGCLKKFKGLVIEVISGDCVVLKPENGNECRYYLASIRCPRVETRTRADEPWSFEAKEFLRKKLIGKIVDVSLEYIKDPPPNTEGPMAEQKLYHVNIYLNDKSISHLLISSGLARTQSHRHDDPHASDYDELVELERQAQASALGIFGPEKLAPKHRINDLIGPANTARAKAFETQLVRQKQLGGVVEYIFNGHRYKIRIPSENLAITFCLGGIRCPMKARKGVELSEPFSAEAIGFARQFLLQREVSIKVQQIDKSGAFIGSLKMNGAPSDFAVTMLEQGLASTVPYSLRFCDNKDELVRAESKAIGSKLNIWSIEGALEKLVINEEDEVLNLPIKQVLFSHVNCISDFYIHTFEDVQKMQSTLQTIVPQPDTYTPGGPPRIGEIVLALFSVDNHWYRGKVVKKMSGDMKVLVFFIDYGNIENVEIQNIKKCPSDIAKAAPIAMHCRLSGLLAAPDFENEAVNFVAGFDDFLACESEILDSQKLYHVILTPSTGPSINEQLSRQGLGRVDRKSKSKILDSLVKHEEVARKQHLNVWRHGDIGDDDEGEDWPPNNARRK